MRGLINLVPTSSGGTTLIIAGKSWLNRMQLEDFLNEKIIELKLPKTLGINKVPIIDVLLRGTRSGVSNTAVRTLRKNYFPHKEAIGRRLYIFIVQMYNLKYCSSCNQVKFLENFNDHIGTKDKKQTQCSECNLNYHKNNKNTLLYKKKNYYLENKAEFIARNAKRRAATLNRTPKWSDISSIEEFYKNCPEGYHVDHIIPLQGKNVSGLHVLKNLQYLPARDNLSKGNKFED